MKESAKNYKRIVIKIGSSLFTGNKEETIDGVFLNSVAGQVIGLMGSGKEILLVSSGAIALGMRVLGLKNRPKELAYLQASASLGQNILMDNYGAVFDKAGIKCAQVLLTWEDLADRRRYLNAKNTLLTLLKLRVLPVINENDTVSTDEIKFGDNDTLSARVAALVSADLLIILSDVDGLMDRDKKVIAVVDEINHQINSLANPTLKATSVGGMVTKIEAARIAVDSGIPCVIANGKKTDIIFCAVEHPESCGTLFAHKHGLTEKQRWIAFGTKPRGKIIIDNGARSALLNRKSLLSVGVVTCAGNFSRGDIVCVCDRSDKEIARGKVEFSSRLLEKVKGIRFEKEVIHCDNIALTVG